MELALFLNPVARPTGTAQWDAYCEILQAVELAERCGYRSAWVTEHHSPSGGCTANPTAILSAFAVRTKRVRLGTAAIIPALSCPLRVAEDASQLDTLSGGRLELGLGRGFDDGEFSRFGSSIPSHQSFVETVVEIRELLASEALMPRPLQPQIPIWIAASSEASAAAAGELGCNVALNPYFLGWNRLRKAIRGYRAAAPPSGRVLALLLASVNREARRAAAFEALTKYLSVHAAGAGFDAQTLADQGLAVAGGNHDARTVIRGLTDLEINVIAVNPLAGFDTPSALMSTVELMAEASAGP